MIASFRESAFTKRRVSRALPFPLLVLVLLLSATVRGDAPPGRYRIARGTVTDTRTGLVWQQVAPNEQASFDQAASRCAQLDLNGRGWRLPTVKELATLLDETRTAPMIDPDAFPETNGRFWGGPRVYGTTTETSPWNPPVTYSWTKAYGVDFQSGEIELHSPESAAYVRCVR